MRGWGFRLRLRVKLGWRVWGLGVSFQASIRAAYYVFSSKSVALLPLIGYSR